MTKMTQSYRYPGLQPFEAKDAALFYGRERESRDLHAQVMVEKMVVLFAKSGMGKSSLLNAGLVPLLEKSNLLPLRIRLSNMAVPLETQFLQELEREELRGSVSLDTALRQSGATLWEQVKAATFTKNNAPALPFFLLDQFEEVFTLYDPAQRQKFLEELAQLTNGTPPKTYLERLRARIDRGEQLDIPALESSPRCKFIFSIRSDLLHLLNALTPLIPDIMRSRFELLPFDREQAEEAITLPAMLRDPGRSFLSRSFQYDDAALGTLINYLSKNGTADVESFQLQILCQYIERLMIAGQKPETDNGKVPVVTPALFGNREGLEAILRNFYTDQIAALPPEKQMVAREIIEEQLITETERRRSVAEDDLLHFNPDRSLLDQLVEMRLLRKEPRLDTFYYEISHDTLVPPILVKYRERQQEEERLAEAERLRQEQAERDALLAEERRKRIRALRITLYSLTLALISILAMIYAFRLRNIAERDKRHAYANDLAFKSQIALRDGDRTAAFRLAEFAQEYVETDNPNVVHALVEALYYNDHPDSSGHRLPWNYNLEGHNAALISVVFSPDGKKLATSSEDNTAKIWDMDSGKATMTLQGHKASVLSAAFSPDGARLATGSADSTVIIWDLGSGKASQTLTGHRAEINSVAFSPDGALLATGSSDNTAKIWDLAGNAPPVTLAEHGESVWSVAFSPEGKWLATGSNDNSVIIWDMKSHKAIKKLTGKGDASVRSIAFSPDGKRIATGSEDNTAKIWDLENGKIAMTFEGHHDAVYSVAFSADGKRLATGSLDKTAKIWDLSTGKPAMPLVGHSAAVRSVAFSPDGKMLATGAEDNTAKIWDIENRGEAIVLYEDGAAVKSVAFSPDGEWLATASEDSTANIWDLKSGKLIKKLAGHRSKVLGVAFSPDGKKLATASADSTARIWDMDSGNTLKILKGHGNAVKSVAFSPDGTRLATGSDDKTVKIWDAGSGNPAMTLSGHSADIWSVAFSPDGRNLATGSEDNTARIWDLGSGKAILTLEGHSSAVYSVAFSPDGTKLATGSLEGTAKVWDLKNGKADMTLDGQGSPVNSVAFSPDGKRLVTGLDDNTARVWDMESGKAVIRLEGHDAPVNSVVFSPDGKRLATGSFEGTAKIWEIDPETVIRRLHSERRLASFIAPQLDAWSLEGLLRIRGENEEQLRKNGEIWQIVAFADLFAQNAHTRGDPDFDLATRLYRSAVEKGGDSELLHRLDSLGSR